MDTVSLKLSAEINQALACQARQLGLRKSQLMRQILETYVETQVQRPPGSLLERISDLAGTLEGGPVDLSRNRDHLDGYGE